ncbi:cytosine permease [Streptomyces sp. NPDC019224]|uniref:cytosine permease n=1 Tax=Streptomyces sp. NPDC019224 TaxID=3154484 RepID=UPI0033C39B92
MTPAPEGRRYGGPGRLFTARFTPDLTMTGVLTGTVGIALGPDFATALAAVALGTLVGAAPTAYPGTWGSRTGSGQLPLARPAFGPGAACPAPCPRRSRHLRAVRAGGGRRSPQPSRRRCRS